MESSQPIPWWNLRSIRAQFSLRSLLFTITGLGILFAAAASLHSKQRQRLAADTLHRCGGMVFVDVEGQKRRGLPYDTWREWIFERQRVVEVDFHPETPRERLESNHSKSLANQQMACFSTLLDTCRIDLQGTQVTDQGIAPLAALQRLQSLNLAATGVTNTGLRHVATSRIRQLNLSGTFVNDQGIVFLNRCSSLEVLVLGITYDSHGGAARNRISIPAIVISDAGFAKLNCPSLRVLNLRGAPITDAGLLNLTRFPRLEELNLVRTGVTDKGLLNLRGLLQLKTLHLVEEIPSLTYITADGPPLTETSVTAEGVCELQSALPNLRIVYGATREIEIAVPVHSPPE
jgi:hypothetical protein